VQGKEEKVSGGVLKNCRANKKRIKSFSYDTFFAFFSLMQAKACQENAPALTPSSQERGNYLLLLCLSFSIVERLQLKQGNNGFFKVNIR